MFTAKQGSNGANTKQKRRSNSGRIKSAWVKERKLRLKVKKVSSKVAVELDACGVRSLLGLQVIAKALHLW